MIPQHYTVQEVAEKLAVHEDTIKNWITLKKMEAVKVGRGYRISEPVLLKLLDSRTIRAKTTNS